MSKVLLPSLTGLGNQVLLLVVNTVLTLAFIDQFYNHDLPCPLCILQRVGFTLIGLMLLLNLRSGAQPAHYGYGILFAVLGLSVSLRQVLLHVAPTDLGYGDTFFHIHFYTWAFIGFVSLIISMAILLILPDGGTRSRHWFAQFLSIWFVLLLLANLISTLLECGIGPCADNPVSYQGIELLRQWLAK
jgi:disulfide bond formation protein DsbB